jgi:hypothetical protein
MKRLAVVVAVVALLFVAARPARREHNELYWSAIIAEQLHGKAEYRLPDGARVDILTADEAIEIDWPNKWAEGVGQALYYGAATWRRATVVYLVSDPEREACHIERGRIAAQAGGVAVRLWSVTDRNWISGQARESRATSDR